MKKLKWKKKYLSDRSGHWFESNVDIIKWKYIVESPYQSEKYDCFLLMTKDSDEIKLSNKQFKTIEDAQVFCEKHLNDTIKKLNEFLKNE